MKDNVIRLAPKMDEKLLKVFTGYGCVPVMTIYGCTFYIHLDQDTINECRKRTQQVLLGLADMDGFPLVTVRIKVYDRPSKPLQFDCLLNPYKESDYKRIKAFTEQESVVFYWYNEDMKYVRSSEMLWSEENRSRAVEIVEVLENMMKKASADGFEDAKKKYFAAE